MSKLLVVVGITGTQGGSVAEAFMADSSWRIRGITRDTSKPTAQEWAARGVEMVSGDVDNVDSLVSSFLGARAIFAMTDYWYPIRNPLVREEAVKQRISADEQCARLEIQRGKNIALAAASPLVQATLERYVWSSLPDVRMLSGGRYTQVWHFDSKAEVEKYIREDEAMVGTGLAAKASFVHVGLYADNWKRSGAEIERDPTTGGFWHIAFDDGRSKLPFVWAQKDTGPLVKKLVEDVDPGARLLAVSQLLTYREFMQIWAKTLGKTLAGDNGIKQIPEGEFRERLPPVEDIRDHLMSTYSFFVNCGYDGGDVKTLYPKDVSRLNDVSEGPMLSREPAGRWGASRVVSRRLHQARGLVALAVKGALGSCRDALYARKDEGIANCSSLLVFC